jgi:hypothetical protein
MPEVIPADVPVVVVVARSALHLGDLSGPLVAIKDSSEQNEWCSEQVARGENSMYADKEIKKYVERDHLQMRQLSLPP